MDLSEVIRVKKSLEWATPHKGGYPVEDRFGESMVRVKDLCPKKKGGKS